jgi:hypothetical protein
MKRSTIGLLILGGAVAVGYVIGRKTCKCGK